MRVSFDGLEIGKRYDRPFLARHWGYENHYAIAKGVLTPRGVNCIVLFVTREKDTGTQYDDYQYDDFIEGEFLYWEGEKRHRTDRRIVHATDNGDEIHLFYREHRRTPFTYYGPVVLEDYQLLTEEPSKFIFRISALRGTPNPLQDIEEHADEIAHLEETERRALIQSRIGQGRFREAVIRLWGGCSVTGVKTLEILRASHIKPWRDCTNEERLDPYNGLLLVPNLDALFDAGLITFGEEGGLVVSKAVSREDRGLLGLESEMRLRKLPQRSMDYLDHHRKNVFRDRVGR